MKCWSILLSIFLTGILVEASIFSSSLKKLKEKAKSIYKKNFGKDKTWQYTGTDPTEYPGLNHEYRKIQKAKWEKYYECLIVQNKSLDGKISATPEAILGYEGSSVKLICKICLSPIDQERGNTIVWEWAAEGQKHMEQVDLNDNILISPHDKTLMLYNLQKDQTGQYKCKLGETLTLPYFLTVGEIIEDNFIKIECPKAVLFEVKDKNGNIIEVANNSAGVYSMFQGDPPIEPEVQRRLQYGVKGKLVEITCPGSMNNDAPIQWQIGGLNVIPELIEQESKGRMFVSISDRIHIKKALIHDSKYYR
ncbi:unnamed protein product [Brassicogethes aeneus]|uniref:Ig-like domain-containing protein n=1 Tax=Brassicogethes aeneus TaxID=1431903 RepID=A0A9P0AY30_BRAAE|nr:unnamed protein product [Brassicogethes aeneus]